MNEDNVLTVIDNIDNLRVELEGLSKTIEAVAEGAIHLDQNELSTILFFFHNTLDGFIGQVEDQLTIAKRID